MEEQSLYLTPPNEPALESAEGVTSPKVKLVLVKMKDTAKKLTDKIKKVASSNSSDDTFSSGSDEDEPENMSSDQVPDEGLRSIAVLGIPANEVPPGSEEGSSEKLETLEGLKLLVTPLQAAESSQSILSRTANVISADDIVKSAPLFAKTKPEDEDCKGIKVALPNFQDHTQPESRHISSNQMVNSTERHGHEPLPASEAPDIQDHVQEESKDASSTEASDGILSKEIKVALPNSQDNTQPDNHQISSNERMNFTERHRHEPLPASEPCDIQDHVQEVSKDASSTEANGGILNKEIKVALPNFQDHTQPESQQINTNETVNSTERHRHESLPASEAPDIQDHVQEVSKDASGTEAKDEILNEEPHLDAEPVKDGLISIQLKNIDLGTERNASESHIHNSEGEKQTLKHAIPEDTTSKCVEEQQHPTFVPDSTTGSDRSGDAACNFAEQERGHENDDESRPLSQREEGTFLEIEGTEEQDALSQFPSSNKDDKETAADKGSSSSYFDATHMISPGEEEKELSKVITDAVSNKAVSVKQKLAGVVSILSTRKPRS